MPALRKILVSPNWPSIFWMPRAWNREWHDDLESSPCSWFFNIWYLPVCVRVCVARQHNKT
jgi:hypothetical protein